MIDVPSTEFPLNIIDVLMDHSQALDFISGKPVMRPLRMTDANHSVGIFPVNWRPNEDSQEIGNREPTLQRYAFRIHNLVAHTDAEQGRVQYTSDGKKLRIMLYENPALRVALGELKDQSPTRIERFQKLIVGSQQFLNNEVQGKHLFLAATEIYAETEVTTLGGM